jgi:hypothetical protein
MGRMDDEQNDYTMKFQVKGTAYRFAPLTGDQIFAVQLLDTKTPQDVADMLKLLKGNTEPGDWRALWLRLTSRTDSLSLEDLSKAFVKLFERSADALKDAEQHAG